MLIAGVNTGSGVGVFGTIKFNTLVAIVHVGSVTLAILNRNVVDAVIFERYLDLNSNLRFELESDI